MLAGKVKLQIRKKILFEVLQPGTEIFAVSGN